MKLPLLTTFLLVLSIVGANPLSGHERDGKEEARNRGPRRDAGTREFRQLRKNEGDWSAFHDRYAITNKILFRNTDANKLHPTKQFLHADLKTKVTFVPVIESDLRYDWWNWKVRRTAPWWRFLFRWFRPSKATELHGAYVELKAKRQTKLTVITFHGNGDSLYHTTAKEWQKHARVIAIEYSGYSVLKGQPARQRDTLATCRAVIRHLVQNGIVNFNENTVLHGFSLGNSYAIDAAFGLHQRGLHVGSVFLAAPFTSARDAGQALSGLPKFLINRFVPDYLNNIYKIDKFTSPVEVLYSKGDDIIPSRQSQALIEARRRAGLSVREIQLHDDWNHDQVGWYSIEEVARYLKMDAFAVNKP